MFDGGGFAKAEAAMRGLEGTSKQSLQEAAAHSGYFNAEMDKSPGILDRAKNSMNQLGISTKQLGMGMMAAGGAIIGIYAMIAYAAVQAAGKSEDRWIRLTSQLGRSGEEFNQVKSEWASTIDSIVNSTSRGRGEIMEMTNTLVSFGIKSQEAIGKAEPLITGRAFQVGSDLPAATTAYGNLVSGMGKTMGAMKLLKISWADLGTTQEAWKGMQPEQRQQLLDNALAAKGAGKANDAYALTYQGMMNQLKNAYEGFMVAIGTELLPVIKDIGNWAIPMLKGLLEAFKALPGPVKQLLLILPLVIGFFLLIGGAIILLAPFVPAFVAIAGALGFVEIAGWLALAPLLAIAGLGVITVYVAVIASKAVDFAGQIQETYKDPVRTGMAGISSFTSQLPLPAAMRMVTGKGEYGAKDEGKDYEGTKYAVNKFVDQNAAKTQLAWLRGAWTNTDNFIKGAATNTVNYIKGAWNNTVAWLSGLWNRLGQVWGGLVAYVTGAWNNTVAWVVNGASQIYSAGANAFWGIYNAVVGALAAAWSYIQNFVSSAVNALQQVWNSMNGVGSGVGTGNLGVKHYAGGDAHTANNANSGAAGTAHLANNLVTPNKATTTTKNVTNHTHNWNIGSVDSKKTADYVVDQVIQKFTKENDIRGA